MLGLAGVPECDECYDENPPELVEQEYCPACPRKQRREDPILDRLLHYLSLIDSGCPVARHELLDWEWQAIGALKSERAVELQKSLKK